MIRFQPAARDPEPAARDPQPNERPPEPTVAETPPPVSPVAPVPPRAAAPEKQEGDYTVVRVYYGTDRAIEGASDSGGPAFVGWLVWTACTAGLAMVLVAVAFRFYRTRLMRILAAMAVVATGIMSVVTARAGLQTAMTAWQANPPELAYGNKRGEELQLGTCQVSIPRDHQVGEVESPSILRLEFREDPERHVVLLDVVSQPAEEFYADLKACVGQSQQKDAFVFVHGFNVTFEDAARRTAQIAYDVKFEGVPIFYSWPSQVRSRDTRRTKQACR